MKWIFRIESCGALAELVLNIIVIMLKRLFTHSFYYFSQSFLERIACVYYMCPHFNCLHLKCSLADFPWAIEATVPKWPPQRPVQTSVHGADAEEGSPALLRGQGGRNLEARLPLQGRLWDQPEAGSCMVSSYSPHPGSHSWITAGKS